MHGDEKLALELLGEGQGALQNASLCSADSLQGVAHGTLGRRERFGQGIMALVSATTGSFAQGVKAGHEWDAHAALQLFV